MNDERYYIRATDITDYSYCPRKVYIKRVLKIKEPENEKKIIGSLVHEIYDILNEEEENILMNIKEEIEYNQLLNIYYDFISKKINSILEKNIDIIRKLDLSIEKLKLRILSDISKEIELRAKNVYDFIRKNDLYGIELVYNLDPIIYTEYDVVSNRYDIIGRIDRLEIYRKDKIAIPYELKSGRFNKDHILQLYIYYLLLKDEFKFKDYKISKGYIIYTKDGYKMEIIFRDKGYYVNKILDIIDKIYEILYYKKDPGIINDKNKCLKCEFYKICYGKNNIIINNNENRN